MDSMNAVLILAEQEMRAILGGEALDGLDPRTLAGPCCRVIDSFLEWLIANPAPVASYAYCKVGYQ